MTDIERARKVAVEAMIAARTYPEQVFEMVIREITQGRADDIHVVLAAESAALAERKAILALCEWLEARGESQEFKLTCGMLARWIKRGEHLKGPGYD